MHLSPQSINTSCLNYYCIMVIDKSNMKQVLEDFPKQCREAMSLSEGMKVSGNFNKIMVCGMGGSAIGGDILKAILKDKMPVYVIKEYDIPEFIDENTLVFAISYSGNTEETLGALTKAKNQGACAVAISSGGQLVDMTDIVIKVPDGLQPRNAVGYLFFPMLAILHNSGIVNVSNKDLNDLLKVISDTNYFDDKGKDIARKIGDRAPVVYSSTVMEPCAYRLKCEVNENAKHPAFHHVFPEMCHNELVGFKGMERSKFLILLIRNNTDHDRVKIRMDICKNLLSETVDVEEITAMGDSLLAKLFSVIYLGDWIGYHLAMLNREDPTPVDVIENLKRALKQWKRLFYWVYW